MYVKLVKLNLIYFIAILCLIVAKRGITQCTYLAYEAFQYTDDLPLHNLIGGNGWSSPWIVQGDVDFVPGYQIENETNLDYLDLPVLGNYAEGGIGFLTSGRTLNTAYNGPFSDYVTPNFQAIGTSRQDTLWLSTIMRKEDNNQEPLHFELHNGGNPDCNACGSQRIGMGYYGTASEINNEKRWSIRINGEYYLSNNEIQIDEESLLILRLVFETDTTRISLFVDPMNLGSISPPATAEIEVDTALNFWLYQCNMRLGNDTDQGSIDEIRFASTYECVAPNSTTNIELPPTADFTMSASQGNAPFTISFDASSSNDPEGMIDQYIWNFGDGSSTDTGQTITHTFNHLGNTPIQLTVIDAAGLSSTTQHWITIWDDNNTFPCHTTINCLSMADCQGNGGDIRVYGDGDNYELFDQNNTLIPIQNTNEYNNLIPGYYQLSVSDSDSQCTDTMSIQITTDSSSCSNWTAPLCRMELGTNLAAVEDWAVERPMKNRMKHIRDNIITFTNECSCWNLYIEDELDLTPEGYPTSIPQTTSEGTTYVRYFLSASGGNLQADSTYVILYDGTGTISLFGSINVISSTNGRLEFIPNNSSTIALNIWASDINDPIQNIRLLRIQDEFDDLELHPYYSMFLDKISPFEILRFMDWQSTNNNPIIEWDERRESGYFTYSGDTGVPHEEIINLANYTQKDVWICVPHLADDNYIEQMANLYHDQLDSSITIYLEYSNEVWNWGFSQAHYNYQNKPYNLQRGRAYAERSKHVFDIWHGIFQDEECRVQRVLGMQSRNNLFNAQILAQLDPEDWDIGSPTFYFHLDESNSGNPVLAASSSAQDVMTNGLNTWRSRIPNYKIDFHNIHMYGKKMLTYEGGQHYVGNGDPYQNAIWDAQNTDEMYDLYMEVLDSMRNWGCLAAVHFNLASHNNSIYGSWGALGSIDVQPPFSVTAKKYQALIDNKRPPECSNLLFWNGEKNSNWSTPCNWDTYTIPNHTKNVVIPSQYIHTPSVDQNFIIKSLLIMSNASINIENGVELQILD